MANTTIHQGPYMSIPEDASPGLLFLKQLLPTLDALDAKYDSLKQFMSDEAAFAINDNSPIGMDTLRKGLEMRSKHLSTFHHELHKAWDIKVDEQKRTVMFESTSTTLFRGDAEGIEVRVKEFSVLELEAGDGAEGLEGTSMKTWMDSRAVENRAAKIKSMS